MLAFAATEAQVYCSLSESLRLDLAEFNHAWGFAQATFWISIARTTSSFVGGVRGVLESSSSQIPTEGVTVLADTNGNGVRDSLTFVVDPDDVIDHENPLDENGKEKEYPLLNAYPGVTLTKFSLDAFPSSAVTAEHERDFPNKLENRIFATGGIDWFSNSGVLRFDFYRPVN